MYYVTGTHIYVAAVSPAPNMREVNMIADDPNPPMRPSGIRFGTPAITTRGFKEKECARVAELMIEVLRNHDDESIKKKVHEEIKVLARKFPIPDVHF